MQQELQDFFGLSPEDASEIVAKTIVSVDSATEAPDESDESGNNDEAEDDELDQDDDDDGELIGEGECELCERFIKLTKHHLIPKSTYHRLEARLVNASTALAKGDEKKAIMILGPGLHHLIPCLTITSNRAMIRKTMTASTCLICRPCHSMIHRTHDNLTLALEYSTVEQLLSDKAIYNFCKWAHNQKSGKYSALAKSRWQTWLNRKQQRKNLWGTAICNSNDVDHRIRTHNRYQWVWIDPNSCSAELTEEWRIDQIWSPPKERKTKDGWPCLRMTTSISWNHLWRRSTWHSKLWLWLRLLLDTHSKHVARALRRGDTKSFLKVPSQTGEGQRDCLLDSYWVTSTSINYARSWNGSIMRDCETSPAHEQSQIIIINYPRSWNNVVASCRNDPSGPKS